MGGWNSSVSVYSFAFQFSTPSPAVTPEWLCWSGLMLLKMVLRPVTHFTMPAKELSDSGSYSHGSDLKMWPQRNAQASHPMKSSLNQTQAPNGVHQLCFWLLDQSCCLHGQVEKLQSLLEAEISLKICFSAQQTLIHLFIQVEKGFYSMIQSTHLKQESTQKNFCFTGASTSTT